MYIFPGRKEKTRKRERPSHQMKTGKDWEHNASTQFPLGTLGAMSELVQQSRAGEYGSTAALAWLCCHFLMPPPPHIQPRHFLLGSFQESYCSLVLNIIGIGVPKTGKHSIGQESNK